MGTESHVSAVCAVSINQSIPRRMSAGLAGVRIGVAGGAEVVALRPVRVGRDIGLHHGAAARAVSR